MMMVLPFDCSVYGYQFAPNCNRVVVVLSSEGGFCRTPIEGRFALEAVGFAAADPIHEGRTLVAQGAFHARAGGRQ